jgi:hypothetical protein
VTQKPKEVVMATALTWVYMQNMKYGKENQFIFIIMEDQKGALNSSEALR